MHQAAASKDAGRSCLEQTGWSDGGCMVCVGCGTDDFHPSPSTMTQVFSFMFCWINTWLSSSIPQQPIKIPWLRGEKKVP